MKLPNDGGSIYGRRNMFNMATASGEEARPERFLTRAITRQFLVPIWADEEIQQQLLAMDPASPCKRDKSPCNPTSQECSLEAIYNISAAQATRCWQRISDTDKKFAFNSVLKCSRQKNPREI